MTHHEALVRSEPILALAGTEIRTGQQLAERIRAIQEQAHILSPMSATSAIAPSHVINVGVVVLDPTFDPGTGTGADVYHQASIHKRVKRSGDYVPDEVSLTKTALTKLANTAGISWIESRRMDDGRIPSYWSWQCVGEVIDFDGRVRRLPAGSAEVDLRDGSAQIGEWTPEAWSAAVAAAERERARLPRGEQWKAKPSVNGWTLDRVRSARRFGLRLAEAKAMNAVIRNIGVKSTYRLAELEKPFVLFRCSYVPDMTDPGVRRLVTEKQLGAAATLYPERPAPASGPPGEVSPTADDALGDLPVEDEVDAGPAAPSAMHVTYVGRRRGGGFVVKTGESGDRRLLTDDEAVATEAKRSMETHEPVDLHWEARRGEAWIISIERVRPAGVEGHA